MEAQCSVVAPPAKKPKRSDIIEMVQWEDPMEVSAAGTSDIAFIENQIRKVEEELDSIQDEIHEVKMKLEENSGDREVFLMLMGKEKQLRDEKKQVRDKEKQLRDKENQLREEKKQQREEKIQLRDMMILQMKEKKPPPTALSPEQQRTNILKAMNDKLSAASSFAREWEKKQNDISRRLCCHRPASATSTHVSIFYSGFATFVEECDSVDIDPTDTSFVIELTMKMSRKFTNEAERMKEVIPLLSEYLDLKQSIISTTLSDGLIECPNPLSRNSASLILEGKNEVGSGGGDPYMQSAAYYVKNVDSKLNFLHRSPCFLTEVFGPNMAISGAVLSDTACVDRLTTVSLLYQPHDYKANIRLARTLKALKNALHRLQAHYRNLNTQLSAEKVDQLKYPMFRSYTNTDGNTVDFVYTGKIKDNVFRAISKNPSRRLIVKFVIEYGTDAHKLCAEKGYAPILFDVKQVTTDYSMVVMEEVCDSKPFCEVYATYDVTNPSKRDHLKKQCRDALDVLHSNNLCHGDFRECNILVSDDDGVYIIDFDWAGKANEKKYPNFMNHKDIQWPENATCGKCLQIDHDNYWFQQLCPY